MLDAASRMVEWLTALELWGLEGLERCAQSANICGDACIVCAFTCLFLVYDGNKGIGDIHGRYLRMIEKDVIIIGGGQAGLSMGYYLQKKSV